MENVNFTKNSAGDIAGAINIIKVKRILYLELNLILF